MKKFIAIVCAAVTVFAFAACGSKKCEMCQKDDVKTKKYTVQGKSAYLCEDCGKLAEFASGIGALGK